MSPSSSRAVANSATSVAFDSLRLNAERRATLEEIARRKDRDLSYVIRKAIDEYIERHRGRPHASYVRRSFKAITKRAGLGKNWTPREMRHSFVSLMSANGVPIETIADLVGHAGTAVTEAVHRHQLKPVITKGAETMSVIFNQHNRAKSA